MIFLPNKSVKIRIMFFMNSRIILNTFMFLALLNVCIQARGQTDENDLKISFRKAGEIMPRHAKEIESSNWSIGAETIDRHFSVYANWKQYLGPLGAKKARIQSGWARTETEKGKYNWEWLDEIVLDMVSQGVIPWMQVSYGNTIYEGGGGINLGDGIPESEEAVAAWQKYIKALVNRYKMYIDEWEVWNEPNYHINYEKYANFLILTAEIIKNVQADPKVLAFALGSRVDYEFADKVLKILYDRGKIDLIDQVTYHRNIAIPEDYINENELDRVIRKYSASIISRQGEAGFPGRYSERFALAKQPWNELQQAKSNIRRMMLDLGRDRECNVFTIVDLRYVYDNKVVMNPKGLIEADENMEVKRLKPAYFAVQNVCSVFDNSLEKDNSLAVKFEADNIYHFEYINKTTTKNMIVYWKGGEVPKAANEFKTCILKVSGANISKAVLADLRTGKVYSIPKRNIRTKGNELIFKDIILYDSPVLITDRSLLKLKK